MTGDVYLTPGVKHLCARMEGQTVEWLDGWMVERLVECLRVRMRVKGIA